MVNFQIHEIFIKNFGGVALGLKFQKLKIHHNKLLIMKFYQWNKSLKRKNFFFEKCEQTAEISWHFFLNIGATKKCFIWNCLEIQREIQKYYFQGSIFKKDFRIFSRTLNSGNFSGSFWNICVGHVCHFYTKFFFRKFKTGSS